MITEEYLKDHFVNAYFIDQERKNIEVLTTNEDKSKVYTTITVSYTHLRAHETDS